MTATQAPPITTPHAERTYALISDEVPISTRTVATLSDYTERWWLPILGPTTIALIRHVAQLEDTEVVTGHELAVRLGVGDTTIAKTVRRGEQFGVLAVRVEHQVQGICVPTRLRPVPAHLRAKWPLGMQTAYALRTER